MPSIDPIGSARIRSLARRAKGLFEWRAQKGQSIVEVALVVPVAMLLLAGTVDLGRLFFARMSIENAAREGAFFAAVDPRCDTAARSGCADPYTADWRVRNELTTLDGLVTGFSCVHGTTTRDSVEECQAGDTYVVTVEDRFDFVTPVLVPLLGPSLTLAASATAPVLNDAPDATAPFASFAPDADDSPTPPPDPSIAPTASPAATPAWSMCTVADLVGIKRNSALNAWQGKGFTGAVIDGGGNGNYVVGWQDLTPGTSEPCSSSVTVAQDAPSATPAP